MKKLLKVLLIVVPLVVIVGVVVLLVSLNGIVKSSVETVLPKITGTPVTIETVNISPFSGKAELKGFIIGNPEGYQTPSSFELGTVRAVLDLRSLMSDTIVIDEILIEGPQVTYEVDLPSFDSNIQQIQKNVEAFAGPPSEKPEPEADKGPSKNVLIKKFVFKEGKVHLSAKVAQGRKLSVPLPAVEKENIGSGGDDKGTSIADAAKEIFTDINTLVIENGKKLAEQALAGMTEAGKKALEEGTKALEGAKDTGKEALEGAKESGKEAVEGAKESGKEAVESGKDAVEGLKEGVKDLFK